MLSLNNFYGFVLNDPVNFIDPWGLTRGSHYNYRLNNPDYSPESNRPGHYSNPDKTDDCCKTSLRDCLTKCAAAANPIENLYAQAGLTTAGWMAGRAVGGRVVAALAGTDVLVATYCARACAADKCGFD